MKVLLVDNFIMPEEGSFALLDVHPHLGLLALAASIEQSGHTVEIVDPKRLVKSGWLAFDATLYERAAGDMLACRPDVVGFTTLGCSFLFACNVAAILKRRAPALPIMVGGPHATMLHREILERFPQFDIVMRHEADDTVAAVLDNLEGRTFEHIPGVSWRLSRDPAKLCFTDGKPKVADLDRLPMMSYEHYPMAHLDLKLLRIEAGRGCPFNCTFCSTAGFFQRSFRLKSAERLVRELDVLHSRYGVRDFKLDHDMFTVNKKKVAEFCDAVRGRGYRWRASARVDGVDADLLAKMAGAGCVGLYFGIETGSPRMQRLTQKRLDLGLVQPVLDLAERLGIETTASFITGYPDELEQDQNETLDMVGRCLSPSCLVQLHMLAPEPGTPLFDQHGRAIRYDGYGSRYNAGVVGAGDEQLILDHPDIFQTYYYYPSILPRERNIFAVEIVDLLRRAGPTVLRYLLRAYDGRLSKLVDEVRSFANARGPVARPDVALVEAYFKARFGPGHHVVSLIRYAFGAQGPSEGRARQTMAAPPDRRARYALNSSLRILGDMHDCAYLMERIEAAPGRTELLDESETGELGTYVVNAEQEPWAVHRIAPGVEEILGLFARPRRCEEVSRIVRTVADGDEIGAEFFADLIQARIIVPSTAGAPLPH
jgi:radical SAM superfamily enzyme YgiQ (UPF0313 family)